MFDLTGKVALITGAAGGLGDKIARTLHAQGATLALTDMRAEPMEKLKAELGDRVEVFTANLTNAEAVKTLVDDVEAKLGRIDILVNNAGLTRDNFVYAYERRRMAAGFGRKPDRRFQAGACRYPRYDETPFCRIIGIASVVGVMGNAGQANYAASKGGMIAMNQKSGSGSCLRRRYSQLYRSRLYQNADDRCFD